MNEFEQFLSDRGITQDQAAKFNLRLEGDYIRIPYYDPWNNLIFEIKRHVREKVYLNQPRAKLQYPYGLNLAKRRGKEYGIIVTEGPFDAIAGDCLGFPAVAVLGCKLSLSQASWIWAYTDRVVLAFDSDEAGKLGTSHAFGLLRDFGIGEISVVRFPDSCKDLGDFLCKYPDTRLCDIMYSSL